MDLPLAARFVLGAIFAVAGLAKLADLDGSRAAVAEFGVPDRLAKPIGVVLPLAELAVAALVLPAATAQIGASGALALLAVLSGAIAWSDSPDCHCFGQLHAASGGRRALARNFALALLAGVVLVAGDPGG